MINENLKANKDINLRMDDLNEKINDLKNEYQTKETQFKTHKIKLKEHQDNLANLINEYEEAKESIDEIKVI